MLRYKKAFQVLYVQGEFIFICFLIKRKSSMIVIQPLPELDPTYSAPVQAPPTELSPGYLETDDEDFQETSGQEKDSTTATGK